MQNYEMIVKPAPRYNKTSMLHVNALVFIPLSTILQIFRLYSTFIICACNPAVTAGIAGDNEAQWRQPRQCGQTGGRQSAHQRPAVVQADETCYFRSMNGTELPNMYCGILPSHLSTAS